ncbi:120.7 kDa protein in NOF-FB transposable element [Frankliniella fusca]|uniref:120.7 kDa protein in NOF-FB transposable element n=1 Tax=Frankliniella fusca TaxID=407009 RepID=A0AAE1HAM0_9NEOP|nr:120.7 kDa protein in NOF-FB transposable element [Frankliniella fusca]
MMENPEELPRTNVRENVKCQIPCLGMTTVKCKFGPHLLVSVDVYGSSEELKTPRTTIKLEDLPVTLKLLGSQFILSGVAARQPGHYVAYCRRATGHWEVFNDLSKSVKGTTATELIQPVLLMYAAID